MVRKRGLPGTGCLAILRLKRTRADFSPVGGFFLLFNFSVHLSYDRLSFDGGVLTNASGLPSFWTTAKCAFIFPCFPAFLVRKLLCLKSSIFLFSLSN